MPSNPKNIFAYTIQHHTLSSAQNPHLQIIKGARAAPQVALRVVVQVDPAIGCELGAPDHRAGLVHRARVLQLGVGVESAGPQQAAALLWLHGQVQAGEGCLAAFLDVCGEVEMKLDVTNQVVTEIFVGPNWSQKKLPTQYLRKAIPTQQTTQRNTKCIPERYRKKVRMRGPQESITSSAP